MVSSAAGNKGTTSRNCERSIRSRPRRCVFTCLFPVSRSARLSRHLALAVLGVVISFFSAFTGMVNLLISYFTGVNTFTVALQRTPAATQQRPTQERSATTQPTQQPSTQTSGPFAVTSISLASGPASGGTLIVIHGSGVSSVTNVVMNSDEPPLPKGTRTITCRICTLSSRSSRTARST